jgi:S-DNA-T family DNA segregation ATPase FtsK/SpoIIIE
VPVGLDLDEAEPLSIDLEDGPHFIVTGTVAGGKTTLLQSWLLALADRNAPGSLELYLVDLRNEDLAPLASLPHCRQLIADADTLDTVVRSIADEMRLRRQTRAQRQAAENGSAPDGLGGSGESGGDALTTIVLAIDGFDELNGQILEDTKATLEELIRRRDVGLGFHILLAARAGDLTSSYDGWVRALLDRPTGCWVGPVGYGDLQLFNAQAPASDPTRMAAAGEGYFVRRGRLRRLKAATAHAGSVLLRPWVERLARDAQTAGRR